jgi:hypothetical protein
VGILTTGIGAGVAGPSVEVTCVQHFEGSAYTTTSATAVAIDDAALGIELTLAVGDEVYLDFDAPFGISSPGNLIGFDWLLDGPGSGDTLLGDDENGATAQAYFEFGTNATDIDNRHASGKWVAVEDGVHTFKPRWKVTGGVTASLHAGGGTRNAPVVHRAIVKRA